MTTTTVPSLLDTPETRKFRIPKVVRNTLRSRMAVIGLIIVSTFIFVAIAAPWIAPYEFDFYDLMLARDAPSEAHPLGNDPTGKDMLTQLMYGAQVSLMLGIISVGIGLFTGIPLGIIAGYFGGIVDTLIMVVIDIMLAFPSILLAILFVAFLGSSLQNAIIAIGVLSIPIYTRLVRSSTMGVKQELYIEAARAAGSSHLYVLVRHVLPNVLAPVIVQSTLQMAVAIQASAALGFLGLGAPTDVPEWGNMLQKGRDFIRSAPHIVLYPGLATMMVVFGFSLLGDGLRDALDPRLRGSR
ncbi:MAG: ABC transporter permease [Anaerolineae bacterium]|nr:ABC transporter permease [Anaerolineae bacterium]